MQDEQNTILNDLLSRWHSWCKAYSFVAQHTTSPLFTQVTSSRRWDSADEVIQDDVDDSTMEAVDFHVYQLPEQQKAVIHIYARNLHCGASVWSSPRVPKDPMERAIILMEAKNALTRRLMTAGVV